MKQSFAESNAVLIEEIAVQLRKVIEERLLQRIVALQAKVVTKSYLDYKLAELKKDFQIFPSHPGS